MVSSFKIWVACPSISFLFARLGGSLGVFPYLGNFVYEGSSLSAVLADLGPVLHQSLDWFEGLEKGQKVMSEVRSSELKTGLSSNDGPVEAGDDTIVSSVREVRAFHALDEVCGLDGDTLARFRDRFQFSDRVRIRLPREEDRACHFLLGEVCFYEAAFQCGLRFPIHPFLMELLDSFGIAPTQLMPNSWRIVISYKRLPKLKSRYKEHVEKAIEYAKSIEDFDDLVDLQTLAFYCLGPDPSGFVLHNLDIEEKKRMTTKFNQSIYAQIRVKKNEPLSNLRAKTVRVTEKGSPVVATTPLTPGTESVRMASADISIKEITLRSKRQRVGDKQKEKVDSGPSSVWDDVGIALSRA
ncbi:hypothetical protein SO802_026941 [Lithocarpus litseifolius]|uniref:Transposase (putative) gypsy type domain-containing protein n=1 Tax=Lithocarpus litseifolius TaxID=425828 RepID=A0AAW2C195_9ROSI